MTANQQVTKQQCVRHKLEGGLKIVLMEFWLSILWNAVRYLCCFRMSPLSLCSCWNIILDVQYSAYSAYFHLKFVQIWRDAVLRKPAIKQHEAICSVFSICNFSILVLLFVFVSSLPHASLLSLSSKFFMSGHVCALSTPPSWTWHALISSLGGQWQRRRVAGIMIHLCTIGWARQIGS